MVLLPVAILYPFQSKRGGPSFCSPFVTKVELVNNQSQMCVTVGVEVWRLEVLATKPVTRMSLRTFGRLKELLRLIFPHRRYRLTGEDCP